MKKSTQVTAGLITAIAAATMTNGCSTQEAQHCVDQYGRVLPSSYCSSGYHGGYTSYGGHYTRISPSWAYGGSGSGAVGSRLSGYSGSPHSGGFFGSSVSRGGFGGHGGGHGGGE